MNRVRPSAEDRAGERRLRLRRGHSAEWLASLLLMAKGYRILARRHRTPEGEIDIIAARGRRVAFVEVKRRLTPEAAEAALTPHQAERIGRAAEYWIARRPAFQNHEIGLDAVLIVPRRLPRHIRNAMDRL